MTKQELIETYTAEQLAEMVEKRTPFTDKELIQKWKELAEEFHNGCCKILEENERLQSEVEKYRKAFEDAKKERDCQIAEYQKKIEELENHHKFSIMQIDDVLVEFLGVTHEIMDKPRDFEKVLQELVNKDKTELERAKNTINQIDDILEKIFGVRHDTVDKPDEFEKILTNKVKGNVTDFLTTEPIKVAEMLINATYTREKGNIEKAFYKAFGNNSDMVEENVFDISELRQIAEHLLVYCNHNAEADG